MSPKAIFLLTLCSLISSPSPAQETSETNNVRLNLEVNLNSFHFADDIMVIELLKENGITIDERSTIYVHEEKNTVNLVCFECLTRHLDNNTNGFHSRNERTIK